MKPKISQLRLGEPSEMMVTMFGPRLRAAENAPVLRHRDIGQRDTIDFRQEGSDRATQDVGQLASAREDAGCFLLTQAGDNGEVTLQVADDLPYVDAGRLDGKAQSSPSTSNPFDPACVYESLSHLHQVMLRDSVPFCKLVNTD